MTTKTKEVATSPGGIGFLGLLTVLFIGLKLTEVIDWSWWWVLAPLWLPWAVIFGIAAVMMLIAGVFALVVWIFDR